MKQAQRIAAVVVTYNRKTLLMECIKSLLAQDYSKLDILIIDNASSDGTKQMIDDHFSNCQNVIYVNTGANLGGAGGFQFGINEAIKRQYGYLWLMDDDSIPTPSALSSLIAVAKDLPRFGFLSSKILWKDHSICQMNIPKVKPNKRLTDFNGQPKRIIMATFVSFFVSAQVVKQVGLPIKEFFIWADDLEYSSRISRRYPSYFVPSSIIIHKCSTNNGSNIATDSPQRLNRYQYSYRNEVYVFRREGVQGWMHILLKPILNTVRVVFLAKGEKAKRLKIIWHSTFKGFHFHPKIEFPR